MNEENLPAPLQTVCRHFDEHSVNYRLEYNHVTLRMDSGNAVQKCYFRVGHRGEVFGIFVHYPVMVRADRRASVGELIHHANFRITLGKFEFDMASGEIYFHLSHLMHNQQLDEETFKKLFSTAMSTADRYFPALMQHLHGGLTPEDAVFMAEVDFHADQIEDPAPAAQSPASQSPTKSAPAKPADKPAVKPAAKRRKKKSDGEKA